MLTLDLCAKVATATGLFFLGSLSGALSMIVNFVILILGYTKEKLNKKWTIVFILLSATLVGIMIFKFEGISSVLVFFTSFISLISIWWLDPQKMRIAGLTTCATYFVYMMTIRNWVGFAEIIVFTANLLSFIKYKKELEVQN